MTSNVDDKKPVSEMANELWGVYLEIKVISLIHWCYRQSYVSNV
ncbi:Mobile element protein [Candidatus Enterovibrio escicola]|uniref:Mobile element protein n=1 Tax=Candidatus Enterovibrio escicola TaxID=1927127 RepID=A0A2A5T4P3_9GAMM|nr:hypothetical protein [Candidatus Enterovibrio escacola]PCS23124.1 Mobile element protein [Candidatus Enterovibrio escacola]